ncbi:MAG: Wzz/FepE/Etk N-terminal domain-containing protein [Chloroflexi bacterium]|nr:Wzz/FepE/Etk N-terminal domain-containing protein [Chloroflexota bacterium]
MRQIEAVEVLRIIWRRLWLIIIIVGVTLGLLMFRARIADPVYEADVTLMITTPDREDVAVTDEYTFTSDRDLIVTAVNSFVEIAQYDEVKDRTKAVLSVTKDYDVTVDAEIGADLIYVIVTVDEAELAQQIANTHAEQAIQYFGELRARPSTVGLGYFENELAAASQELTDAESAMTVFLTENNIAVSLEDEIALQQEVLEELEIAQVQGQTTGSESSDELSFVVDGSRSVAELIRDKRDRLNELILLRPQYNLLKGDVERAQRRYDTLSARMTDTELRGSFAGEALFVQIIKEAEQPESPRNQTTQTLILGFIASLGFGILSAFALDYVLARW